MLVLIAGVTGNLGQNLVRSLLSRGHRVRGLGRNPSKLDNDIQSSLESFVQSQNHYDVPALEKACEGVDAVICSYLGTPELQLEGQLLLLRAAERVEVLFSVPGHGDFGPENHGVWDPLRKEMHVWGQGNEIWHWTTEGDCAEFTAAILDREDAEDQQFWTVCSGESTLPEMAETYRKVRGIGGNVVKKGNLEDLRHEAFVARARGSVKEFWKYIGWFYQLFTVDGSWVLEDLKNGRLGVQTTSLEKFIEDNDEI
ncbi:hypothetical protein PRZ48_004577 [Zasmidium cellare]|uniref:NAD(P)-binding domain-containing protein n=1 Tax=Zasmidium cellare TaxID=395010 RepID=A0ABR0EQB7_ZASCE|nr:hypothetical protein PRZ48_004577 [Zasmidium cellare]